MIKLILILTSLLVFSCGKSNQSTQQSQSTDSKEDSFIVAEFPNSYKIYEPLNLCAQKKRLYITHGFGGNKDVYDTEPFADWIINIRQACFEIVSYDLPRGDYNRHFVNGGLDYKNSFVAYLTSLKSSIEQSRGLADINLVGGVSFGGLHSMMSVELIGGFDGFFSLKPVTDYTALYELTEKTTSENFNVFNDYQNLAPVRGLIIYGDQDYRVNYRLTLYLKELLDALPSSNVSFVGLTEGHSSNPQNLQIIMNWINANY